MNGSVAASEIDTPSDTLPAISGTKLPITPLIMSTGSIQSPPPPQPLFHSCQGMAVQPVLYQTNGSENGMMGHGVGWAPSW